MNQPNFADFDVSHVKWVSYGSAPTPPDVIGPLRKSFPQARLRQRLRAHQKRPRSRPSCPSRVLRVPPRDGGLRGARGGGRPRRRGPVHRRGRAAHPGPEHRGRLLEQAGADGGDVRERVAAHGRTPARVDDDGFVQIVDRKKDMVNRGGENVYCVEVENALIQHPDVFEVAVMGVPDTMMGEKVGAEIVPQPGATIDPQALRDWAMNADRRLQGAAVRHRPARPTAPQPRRQGPQAQPPPRGRLGQAARASWRKGGAFPLSESKTQPASEADRLRAADRPAEPADRRPGTPAETLPPDPRHGHG